MPIDIGDYRGDPVPCQGCGEATATTGIAGTGGDLLLCEPCAAGMYEDLGTYLGLYGEDDEPKCIISPLTIETENDAE